MLLAGLRATSVFILILVVWLSADFVCVGMAYAFQWHGVFGKSASGQLKAFHLILFAPFLALTWLVWQLGVSISRGDAWDEIAPGLFVGRRTLQKGLPNDVNFVIDLTAEFPKVVLDDAVAYRCLPTLDGSFPNSERFIELATSIANHESGNVFIHCANGHGRSVTLMAAVLMYRSIARNVDEAFAIVRKSRPAAHPNRSQRLFLENIFVPQRATNRQEVCSKEDTKTLIRLLEEAAKQLTAVKGPIWSSYETGADIAEFVLECIHAIDQGSITLPQKRELWRIFAPTCDWDDVVGDCDTGNRVFALIDRLYGHEFRSDGA